MSRSQLWRPESRRGPPGRPRRRARRERSDVRAAARPRVTVPRADAARVATGSARAEAPAHRVRGPPRRRGRGSRRPHEARRCAQRPRGRLRRLRERGEPSSTAACRSGKAEMPEVGPEAACAPRGSRGASGRRLDGGPAVSQHPIEHRRVPLLEPRSRHPDRGDLARCGELHAESLQEALIVGGERAKDPRLRPRGQRHAATGPLVRPREGRLEDALGDPARDLGGRTPREDRGDEGLACHARVALRAFPGRGVHQESPGPRTRASAIAGARVVAAPSRSSAGAPTARPLRGQARRSSRRRAQRAVHGGRSAGPLRSSTSAAACPAW